MTEPPAWPPPEGSPSGSEPLGPTPSAPGWGQPGWGPPPPGWGPPPGQGWGAAPPPPPPPPAGAPPPSAWGASPYGGIPLAAPRPGIIPLRPLALGEILDGAFTLIRRNPRVTLGLSACVAAVNATLSALIIGLGGATFDVNTNDSNSFSAFNSSLASGFSLANLLTTVLSAILGFVLTGMITVVVGEAVLGREISISAVWQRMRPRFLPLVGLSFLAALLPFLGLIGFIVGGIFLWGAYALAVPAFVLEQTGVIQALRRSWRLAVPDWWRVWGIRALGSLLVGFIGGILAIPFFILGLLSTGVFTGHTPTGTPVLFLVFAALGSLVSQTVTTPLTAGILSLLYVDRRMRAEGLDVTLVAATQPVTSVVSSAAPPP